MSDSIEQIAAVLEGWADQKMPVTTVTAKSLAARLRSIASLRQVPEVFSRDLFVGNLRSVLGEHYSEEAGLLGSVALLVGKLGNPATPTSDEVAINSSETYSKSIEATPAQAGSELPKPAWIAIDTPGADFDVSFVQTEAEAYDLCEASEYDRTRTNLYTADQMREMYRRGLKDAGA